MVLHTTPFHNKSNRLENRCTIGGHEANEAVNGGIRRVVASPFFWYAQLRKARKIAAKIAAKLVLDARRAKREGASQHISPSPTHPSHTMDAATTTRRTKNLTRDERLLVVTSLLKTSENRRLKRGQLLLSPRSARSPHRPSEECGREQRQRRHAPAATSPSLARINPAAGEKIMHESWKSSEVWTWSPAPPFAQLLLRVGWPTRRFSGS